MAMELRHLRYFIAVAEEGHITRAAERLGMQQPPLSQQIRALERELDVQLFHRKPRGVEMTAAGRALFTDARSILGHIDDALATARRTARGEQGRISVGFTTSVALHPLIPRVIREFREAFPLVSVTLAQGEHFDLIERVGNDQLDAAFVRIANPEGLVIEPLLVESMVVALPTGHALAQSKNGGGTALSLKALSGETFIVYVRPNGARTLLSDAIIVVCHAAGFSPRVGHETVHVASLLNFVAAGLGISIVSASQQRMNIDGVAYRRLKSATHLKVPLNLVSRRGEPSAAVRQFLKLAKRTARNFRVDI